MPKYEKGILGVKKDPKNQMLFSFSVQRGSEWPSDDSDSDYKPSGYGDSDYEEQQVVAKHPKRHVSQKRKKTKKKKKMNVIESDSEDSDEEIASHSTTNNIRESKLGTFDMFNENVAKAATKKTKYNHQGQDLWGQLIPPEVLLRVFQFVVDVDGALPFLCRASRVCTLWSQTATDPRLWCRLDMSYGWIKCVDRTLEWLCKHRLSRLTDLNLCSWKNLTQLGLQAVAEGCPGLETINLSYCDKVHSRSIKSLVDGCTNLSNIDLSFTSTDAVSYQSLKYIVDKQGSKLESLNISGNKLSNFTAFLNSIADSCARLQVLDICNAQFSTDFISLNIERLQRGCPHLRVLRLANSKFRATQASGRVQAESTGFPELTELSLAISSSGSALNAGIGLNNEFMHRLLKTSHDLKLLDIRGCTHLTSHGLQMLSVTDLQHLHVSQSSVCKDEALDVVLHKWRHSLRDLDLSWNTFPSNVLDRAIEHLTEGSPTSQLENLNLSGTPVSCTSVRSILARCPKLQVLNLGSCRGLPRGMKREHSKKELEDLKDYLSDMTESSSDDD